MSTAQKETEGNEGFFVEDNVYQKLKQHLVCLRVAMRNQTNKPHVG